MGRRRDTESLVKPSFTAQPAQHRKANEAGDCHQYQALLDVAVLEMTQIMGEHRFDLSRRECAQQGIEKHDAFVSTEAGEIGVAVLRTLGAVRHAYAVTGV